MHYQCLTYIFFRRSATLLCFLQCLCGSGVYSYAHTRFIGSHSDLRNKKSNSVSPLGIHPDFVLPHFYFQKLKNTLERYIFHYNCTVFIKPVLYSPHPLYKQYLAEFLYYKNKRTSNHVIVFIFFSLIYLFTLTSQSQPLLLFIRPLSTVPSRFLQRREVPHTRRSGTPR